MPPPGRWRFQEHFDSGADPDRHLALRYGNRIHPIGFKTADKRSEEGVYIDVKQGGTLIEYADEDPYVRKHYEEELKKRGVKSAMPAIYLGTSHACKFLFRRTVITTFGTTSRKTV